MTILAHPFYCSILKVKRNISFWEQLCPIKRDLHYYFIIINYWVLSTHILLVLSS